MKPPRSVARLALPRLANSLFVRIFLWFWGAMTLTGIVLLAMEASRTQELSRRWRSVTADAFAAYAITSTQALEKAHQGKSGQKLEEFLKELEDRARIRARLLDEKDREISATGRAVPLSQPEWLAARIRGLTAQARRSGKTEFAPQGSTTLVARLAVAPSGRRYILLGELPAAQYGPWILDPRVQALRLLAVLMTAGAVCWGLGRYLTAPIESLRAATRRLSEGDLSARATSHVNGRRDELAELARDFDRMAAHIQSLIYEKETLLAEQKQLMGAQRRLLGDVSHELRSPLARVSVALEMARDRAATMQGAETVVPGRRSTLEDAHNRIERETEHLGALIDRLLTLSRLESGVQPPASQPVDLGELVRVVAADADFEARPRRRVVSVIACDDCQAHGSPDLLRSAIENVVRNAAHYTAEDTTVEITLSRANDEMVNGVSESASSPHAMITVRDHGPGVPETELQEVFRPFYRASQARDRQSGGAGLGLAITARAVELHGGEVRAHNAPEGGLIVQIRLPLGGR
ncbi:MAG: HAMP domain-containing protein [Armatimonadetes bacterium]|nr:HAMP domain-containing protein [Armatimonadota bacterium]